MRIDPDLMAAAHRRAIDEKNRSLVETRANLDAEIAGTRNLRDKIAKLQFALKLERNMHNFSRGLIRDNVALVQSLEETIRLLEGLLGIAGPPPTRQ